MCVYIVHIEAYFVFHYQLIRRFSFVTRPLFFNFEVNYCFVVTFARNPLILVLVQLDDDLQ